MNIICDKILVIAGPESKTVISTCLEDIFGLEMLEANSENKAFELIYNHSFVLVIIDETLAHIDRYKIGSMLLSHRQTHDVPLLIITRSICPEKFLTDFKVLQIDTIQTPVDRQLLQSKIRIFFDLFKQKKAVAQSIDELDKAYRKIVAQHEQVLQDAFSRKELVNRSSVAAHRMQQPLRSLRGNIYQLFQNNNMAGKTKSNLVAIKTAAENISHISKTLLASPGRVKKIIMGNTPGRNLEHRYKILYIQDSDEDFSIFDHVMNSVIKCDLYQARTLAHSLELIAVNPFDLIFTDHFLPDGTGLDLLSRLNRMRSDIPVIFTLDKPRANLGPIAVSRGAVSYFIKEELSSGNILSIIYASLAKAKITREVADARDRIVMIARKDALTKLHNRQCFDQELESEVSKSKRYNTPLSILILDFDGFKPLCETHGFDTGDRLLTTSAGLIQSMVRDNDVVCRYGGEEFGIVLANTALNGARMMAERIRKRIARHEFEKDSLVLPLTVSIGIASYEAQTDTACSILVKKALTALTSAMDQGGNRVKAFIEQT
jgi:diguanylate cyclase (GGDEF)-like protein